MLVYIKVNCLVINEIQISEEFSKKVSTYIFINNVMFCYKLNKSNKLLKFNQLRHH